MPPKTAAARKAAPAVALSLTLPELAKNEGNAGILFIDGKPAHWLILLPGDKSLDWKAAQAFAKEQGGELPTRKEQALLFANAAAKFERDWYWSAEPTASDSSYAWVQRFGYGHQNYDRVSYEYRARAVRRVPIQ